MSTRRIVLAAAALIAVLAIVIVARPGKPSDAQASPGPAKAQYPEYVERALADLAQRLGIDADKIAVDSAEPQTWNDTSLGLPEPGMMYAQVVTEGHTVTLSYAGKTYTYHVAGEVVRLAP